MSKNYKVSILTVTAAAHTQLIQLFGGGGVVAKKSSHFRSEEEGISAPEYNKKNDKNQNFHFE